MKIDKKQIKAYSKEITKVCKLVGYNPSEYQFDDFFDDASDFYFVPYIKKLAENISDDECEDFFEEISYAIDEVYDSTVEVSLKEVKDYIKKENISLSKFLSREIIIRDIEHESILEWFLNNGNDEIIQKFINWVLE